MTRAKNFRTGSHNVKGHPMQRLWKLVALLMGVPIFVWSSGLAPAHAQCNDLDESLSPCPISIDFGYSVALAIHNGGVVGAAGDPARADAAGAARTLFRQSRCSWSCGGDWRVADDGESGDQYGLSVGRAGAFVMVGAPGRDGVGTAYAFMLGTNPGDEDATIVPEEAQPNDRVGFSLALADVGGTVSAAIAAPRDDSVATNAGAVYIFERVDPGEWDEQAKVTDPNGAAEDRFGFAVAFDGSRLVVGVPFSNVGGADSGKVVVFQADEQGWQHEATLEPDDGESGEWFGLAVALSGPVVVVGAPFDDDDGAVSGSAYVFRLNGGAWSQEQELSACDGGSNQWFGYSVAASGDLVLCGAPYLSGGANADGKAHAFSFDGENWAEIARLPTPAPVFVSRFGFSVAVVGDTVAVGDPRQLTPFPGSGTVYAFELCSADVNSDARVDVDDLIAVILAWGTSDDDADITCDATVDVDDLIEVILSWGLCPSNASGSLPLSLCQEFSEVGLSQNDCDAFLENYDDENYRCWTLHYLTSCGPLCTEPPNCPGSDPYGGH